MKSIEENTEHTSLFSIKRADELIGVLALLGILGAILWGVFSRYVSPRPAAWTYEIALLTFGYLVFFGAVAGVRLRNHAAIDVFVTTLPVWAQRGVVWFNYVLLAAFFALMAVLFSQQAWAAHGVRTVALDLPRSLAYAPLALASIGMLIQHLIVERPWAASMVRNTDSII